MATEIRMENGRPVLYDGDTRVGYVQVYEDAQKAAAQPTAAPTAPPQPQAQSKAAQTGEVAPGVFIRNESGAASVRVRDNAPPDATRVTVREGDSGGTVSRTTIRPD
jgi:hypothetical protein